MLCIKYAINFSTHQTHLSFVIRVTTPWPEFEFPHYLLNSPPHYTYTGPSHYMFKMQIRTRQLYLQHMDKFQTVIMQTYGVKCSVTRGYFYTRSGFIQARKVTHSSVKWHCFTDYLVPKILRQHNSPIFNPWRDSTVLSQHQGPHTEWCNVILKELITHTHTHTHTHTATKTKKLM
jgi:hypothetical protein